MSATHFFVSATRPTAHLRFEGISKSFGGNRVLTDVSFTVSTGERTGLIGENGSGKSTLLRIAAGLTAPDAGTVAASAPAMPAARIGLMHQVPPFAAQTTVAEALESAVAPARNAAQSVAQTAAALALEPEEATLATAYQSALEEAERCDAWAADARIEVMLDGLGLTELPRHRVVTEISSGQRSRLALAWLLLNSPDVLLLDEPTNHLDDSATDHLCQVITTWHGPVLTASHDRAFLNEVVTSLIDLDPSARPHSLTTSGEQDDPGTGIGVTRYSGSYRDYLVDRSDARERWERQYRDEQAELKRLRGAVLDNRSLGNPARAPRTENRSALKFYSDRNAKVVSRRVSSARTQLRRMQERQVHKPPPALSFRGLIVADERLGHRRDTPTDVLLSATEVAVRGRLDPVSLAVRSGENWLITGPNGAGKSSLLAVLAGHLCPHSGSLTRARGVSVGLLSQDGDLPDQNQRGPSRTASHVYADEVGRERAEQVPLSTFGLLSRWDQGRPVATLSAGQRRRLALAVLLVDPPDVLLLDEPTNHLSLALVTELEAGILDYPGAVVVASHDRWLRDAWNGWCLPLGKGSC